MLGIGVLAGCGGANDQSQPALPDELVASFAAQAEEIADLLEHGASGHARSRALELREKVALGLRSGEVEAQLGGRLLEAIDDLISSIPLAVVVPERVGDEGDDEKGRGKDRGKRKGQEED